MKKEILLAAIIVIVSVLMGCVGSSLLFVTPTPFVEISTPKETPTNSPTPLPTLLPTPTDAWFPTDTPMPKGDELLLELREGRVEVDSWYFYVFADYTIPVRVDRFKEADVVFYITAEDNPVLTYCLFKDYNSDIWWGSSDLGCWDRSIGSLWFAVKPFGNWNGELTRP